MAAKRITAPETDPTPEAVEPDTPSPATAPPPDKWDPIPPVVQHFPNGGGARVTRARQADDATARRHVAAGEMFVASFQQSTRKQMLALSEAAAVRACVDALAKDRADANRCQSLLAQIERELLDGDPSELGKRQHDTRQRLALLDERLKHRAHDLAARKTVFMQAAAELWRRERLAALADLEKMESDPATTDGMLIELAYTIGYLRNNFSDQWEADRLASELTPAAAPPAPAVLSALPSGTAGISEANLADLNRRVELAGRVAAGR